MEDVLVLVTKPGVWFPPLLYSAVVWFICIAVTMIIDRFAKGELRFRLVVGAIVLAAGMSTWHNTGVFLNHLDLDPALLIGFMLNIPSVLLATVLFLFLAGGIIGWSGSRKNSVSSAKT